MSFDVFESVITKLFFREERFRNVVFEVSVGVEFVGSVNGFAEVQVVRFSEQLDDMTDRVSVRLRNNIFRCNDSSFNDHDRLSPFI